MRREAVEVIYPARSGTGCPWSPAWSPSKIIELLEPMVLVERRERLREVLGARLSTVTVLMDAPHDPHNGAAVLRSCDAFGVARVHVLSRNEPFAASNVVAKGAERWVEVVEHTSAREVSTELKTQGFQLIGTHPRGELLPEDLPSVERVALVLGNEHAGIGADLQVGLDRSVQIPMVGFVESLNVSVSAAILLRAATFGRRGDLSETELERLYALGLYRTVKRADEILRYSEK